MASSSSSHAALDSRETTCANPVFDDDDDDGLKHLGAGAWGHLNPQSSECVPSPPPGGQPTDAEEGTQPAAAPAPSADEANSGVAEPPSTSLSFNMCPGLFHAARSATKGSPKSFWSHTMYQTTSLSGAVEKVKVHYCTSQETMELVCRQHFLGQDVLGFDLEWLPFATRNSGPRENVSLIQLASPDRIGLFHVAIFPANDDLVSPAFRQIMEDPNVSKVGVQIQGDCTRLRNSLGVTAKGVFELSHLYKQVKFTKANTPELINKIPVALSTQVEDVLRLPLYKGHAVRSSNWMKRLNYQQLLYSASDAYAGIQLYHVLETQRKELQPCPERPYHLELRLRIPVAKPPVDTVTAAAAAPEDQLSHDSGPSSASDAAAQNLPPIASPTPTLCTSTSLQSSRDVRVVAAEAKARDYMASKQNVSAKPSALRAYYIWHGNSELDPGAIARILRDPPLLTNTVVSYILDAIVAEKLPHDKGRLKREIVSLLHPTLKVGRKYGELVRSCEVSA